MKIALDYDQTYSLDPTFWRAFLNMSFMYGHEVRIVTARNELLDRTAPLIEAEETAPVIYCRGIAKKWYLTHFGDGFIPDVWIDDKPESILQNSSAPPEALVTWRSERNEG